MSGSRRDRNIKVPTRGSKSDSNAGSSHRPSRPAEGRPTVPRPQPKKAEAPRQRQNSNRQGGQRRQSNRQGGNRQGGQRSNRPQQKSPLTEETWARVIDHDVIDNVIVAVSEGKMLLCRLEPKAGIDPLLTTSRVYIGTDAAKRVNVERVLGMTNLGRVANHIKADLPLVVQIFIEENQKHFIDMFFNRAGNMSLKQHSFELLTGVGKKKAIKVVGAGGLSVFEAFTPPTES